MRKAHIAMAALGITAASALTLALNHSESSAKHAPRAHLRTGWTNCQGLPAAEIAKLRVKGGQQKLMAPLAKRGAACAQGALVTSAYHWQWLVANGKIPGKTKRARSALARHRLVVGGDRYRCHGLPSASGDFECQGANATIRFAHPTGL